MSVRIAAETIQEADPVSPPMRESQSQIGSGNWKLRIRESMTTWQTAEIPASNIEAGPIEAKNAMIAPMTIGSQRVERSTHAQVMIPLVIVPTMQLGIKELCIASHDSSLRP
jgi:hypothetical protein